MRLTWLALLLAACSGTSTDSQSGPSTSAAPPAVVDPGVSTTVRAVPTTEPSRFAFVDYQTGGGVTGVTRTLRVWPDGRAVCSKGTERVDFSVPAATVTELRSALEAANLPALPPVNGTPTPDATTSRVIFGGQAVRFYGGSMPPSLAPAVARLDRVLVRGCP